MPIPAGEHEPLVPDQQTPTQTEAGPTGGTSAKKKMAERANAWAQAHPWLLAALFALIATIVVGSIVTYIHSGKKDLDAEERVTAANTRAEQAKTALEAKNVYVERLKDVIIAMDGEVPTEEVPSPSELQKLLAEARGLQGEKKLKEADVIATKAIGMDAKSAEAWVLRAEIRRALGHTSWRADLARAKTLNEAQK